LTQQYGATVVGTARNEAALQALQSEKILEAYIVADLTADGECQRVVNEAARLLGGLTTVVNAAGVLQGGAVGAPQTALANYEFNMKINAQVPFEIITAAVPHLKEHDPGCWLIPMTSLESTILL
jgi:NAD(P)-dependent dehydrogenase (short-subunit alcohol dehydrogenase family)